MRATIPEFSKTRRLPSHHWSVLRAIGACRTPALGGHHYQCSQCGKPHFVPHSCRNRHCPTCQGVNGAEWLERQAAHLLPIPYFHVVFTLPHDLNPLIQHNQRKLYDLLFSSASQTLLDFGQNELKSQIGVTAVLHTWSQTLMDHYHLHCIVTGGGLSGDGKTWMARRPHWLFPVRALSVVFRAKFRDGLHDLFKTGQLRLPATDQRLAEPTAFAAWLRQVCRHRWVVYAKRPFANPKNVLAYLCRYTHRVGITNQRLTTLDTQTKTVTFRYKDYANGAQWKPMTLAQTEFLRRFCLHILPLRFVKIRHYGLLSNRDRDQRIQQVRRILNADPQEGAPRATAIEPVRQSNNIPLCPFCRQPTLVLVAVVHPTANPGFLLTHNTS